MKWATRAAVLAICLSLPGCFGIFRDRENDYLKSPVLPRTKVPESLDKPPFQDLMAVPPVNDSRGISRKAFDLPLPDPLNADLGVEMIVIKKLGDTHWVFVDAPPATIWPKVYQFWEDNNLRIARAEPRRGLLESEWLSSPAGDAGEIFDSLKRGSARFGQGDRIENRFQLRITPGVRAGSSEIYLRYKKVPVGQEPKSEIDWSKDSDDLAMEDTVLAAIAYYLGDTINEKSSVSLLAGTMNDQSKAVLVPDEEKPVLRYRLDFARAWATVGSALASARIDVEDLDRSAATYFINFRDLDRDRPGFIRRLFMDDKEQAKVADNRYLLRLDESGDGVEVTVMKDPSTLASADVAERLLAIIKEYSS